MKKFIKVLLTMMICVGLIGCSSDKNITEILKDNGFDITISKTEDNEKVIVISKGENKHSTKEQQDYSEIKIYKKAIFYEEFGKGISTPDYKEAIDGYPTIGTDVFILPEYFGCIYSSDENYKFSDYDLKAQKRFKNIFSEFDITIDDLTSNKKW